MPKFPVAFVSLVGWVMRRNISFFQKEMNGHKHTGTFRFISRCVCLCVCAYCNTSLWLVSLVCYKIMKINDRNLTAWWLFMAVTLCIRARVMLNSFREFFFITSSHIWRCTLWVQTIESSCDSHGIDVFTAFIHDEKKKNRTPCVFLCFGTILI